MADNWDGRQAVLFDLPARKFYMFGLTLWPQDFPLPRLLLIIAALSLFFFTALAGRLWCGFACPQTVWTEAFIWMEQWTEGTRSQRMKLDKAPWSWNKLRARRQAVPVDHVFAVDRLYVRRLLHADPRARRRHLLALTSAAGTLSGACSTASRPTATPATCASRSASTCVRTRASRARCSTRTR